MVLLSALFFAFNLLFMGCGLAIGGIGVWTVTDPAILQTYINLPNDQLLIVSYVAIVVGCTLVIIGSVGCCAAVMSNVCIMCLFSIFLTIILLAAAAAAIVAYVATKDEDFGNKIQKLLFDQLNKTKALDKIQERLKCCGVTGPEQYGSAHDALPESCKNESGFTYEVGCWEMVKKTLEEKVHILAGMTGTLAILGIITIVLSVLMIGSMKSAKVV